MAVWSMPHAPAASSASKFVVSLSHPVPLLPAHSPYADALLDAVQRQDVRQVLTALRYLHVKGLLFPTLGRTGVDAKHSQYGISAVEWQMRQPETPASRVILDLLLLNLDGVRRWQPSAEGGICSAPIQAWARVALQAFQRAKGKNAVIAQSLLYATNENEVHKILRANGIEHPSSIPRDQVETAVTRIQAPPTDSVRYPLAKPTPRYQESYVRGDFTDFKHQPLPGDRQSRSTGAWIQETSSVTFSRGPYPVGAQHSEDVPSVVPKQEEPEEGELLPSEPPMASAVSTNSAALRVAQAPKVHPSRLANLGLDPAAERFRTDPYPTPSLSPSPPPPAPAQPVTFYESRTNGGPLVSDQQEAFAASRLGAPSDSAASSATSSGRAQAGPSELKPTASPPPEKKQRRRDENDQAPTSVKKGRARGQGRYRARKARAEARLSEEASQLSAPLPPSTPAPPTRIPFSLPPRAGSSSSPTAGANAVSPLGLGWAPPAPAPMSAPLSPVPDADPLLLGEPRRPVSCLGKRRRASDGREPARKTVRWRDEQLEEVLGHGAGHVEEVYCDADEEELNGAEVEDEDEMLTDTEDEEDPVLKELVQELIAQAMATSEAAPNQLADEASTPVLRQDTNAIPSTWTWWYENENE